MKIVIIIVINPAVQVGIYQVIGFYMCMYMYMKMVMEMYMYM